MAAKGSASFSIRGFLDALPVTASWRDGYLTSDEELSDVIDQLVTSHYTFVGLDGRTEVAGLLEPLPALLTVIRSFSRITHANIQLPLDPDWGQIVDGEGTVLELRGQGEPKGVLGDLHAMTV